MKNTFIILNIKKVEKLVITVTTFSGYRIQELLLVKSKC